MKPIQQSKTFWVNLTVTVIAMLTIATETPLIANNPELMGYFVAAVGALNIALRFVTSTSVTLPGK